ncbi:phosphate uptake regulator PhoU, partial [Candidatus Bathyarchaeota archaeon]|nr:phosphate uptake regulator PhoU [Candidatus Bathyarchaeota archaeon]
GPEDNITSIIRNIIACYLNGYSLIRLISKNFFSVKQQKAIRKIAQMLYLRILEADTKEIQMATLIDEAKASIETGINRIYKISSSMVRDAFTALKKQDASLARSVYTLDDEVDHFSFFLLRLLRKAAVNPSLANELNLETIDCLDYQTLVHRIEQIADQASSIAQHIIMLDGRQKKISDLLLEKMSSAGADALALYEKSIAALFEKDVKLAVEVIEQQIKIDKLDREIASLSFMKEKDTEVICACCSIRDSIKRIAECAADIAEITLNRSFKPAS